MATSTAAPCPPGRFAGSSTSATRASRRARRRRPPHNGRMTWSIVACDADGSVGVAVTSRFFAVGALCPHGRSGVGALATQALVNPLYAQRGLDALARGDTPVAVVRALTAEDAGRDHRQLHMIDAAGRVAAHTGAACIDWCGHLAGDG